MTILRTLLGERRATLENPSYPLTAKRIVEMLGGSPTTAGVSVDTAGAISRSIVVYRCIALVAGAIASLPMQAFRTGPSREAFHSDFITKPHYDMPPMELWETALFHLLGWGNFFAEKIYAGSELVKHIDPVNPAAVEVTRVATTVGNPQGKRFTVSYQNGSTRDFTPREMLHVPGPTYDGTRGLSPIGVARQGIGVALAAEEYGARLFGNGTLAQGFLHTDASIPDQETADEYKRRWGATYSGLENAHSIAVLDRGLKFENLTIDPIDAQFLESRQFQDEQIAMLYGVPPHLVGMTEKTSSWGTGIESQNRGLIVYTLKPWMVRLEQRISLECLPPPIIAQFNTADLLRGDEQARAAAARGWIEAGTRTRQEVRLSENLPPRDGLDRFVVPSNWRLLGDDGNEQKDTAAVELPLSEKVDMAGQLIRAGFEPASVIAALDLPDMVHTGGLPVTVKVPTDDLPNPITDTQPAVPLAASKNGQPPDGEHREE